MTSINKQTPRTLADIDLHTDKMVDMAFIVKFTGLTDKWFYKLISLQQFPKPIKMGSSSRWLESEVSQWFVNRIEASRS